MEFIEIMSILISSTATLIAWIALTYTIQSKTMNLLIVAKYVYVDTAEAINGDFRTIRKFVERFKGFNGLEKVSIRIINKSDFDIFIDSINATQKNGTKTLSICGVFDSPVCIRSRELFEFYIFFKQRYLEKIKEFDQLTINTADGRIINDSEIFSAIINLADLSKVKVDVKQM